MTWVRKLHYWFAQDPNQNEAGTLGGDGGKHQSNSASRTEATSSVMWAVLIVVSQLITQHVKSIMENPADVAHRATVKTFLVEVANRMGGKLDVQEKAACKAIMTEQLTQEHELEAAYRQHVQDIFFFNSESF